MTAGFLQSLPLSDCQKSPELSKSGNKYETFYGFQRLDFAFRFPAKPIRFVIARRARAPDAAIFDETICHSVTNYGRAE